MDPEKYQAMKEFNDTFSDMPDGAFFAMASDMHEWETEDWVEFAEAQQHDPEYQTP